MLSQGSHNINVTVAKVFYDNQFVVNHLGFIGPVLGGAYWLNRINRLLIDLVLNKMVQMIQIYRFFEMSIK